MGRLAKLQKEYSGTGVQFLGVVTDVYAWGGQTGDDAAHYISSASAEYPNVGSTAALTSGVSYIPSTSVYDSTGTMIARLSGEHSREEWINIIETLAAKVY